MTKIKERRKDLRPREKLKAKGPEALSDYELLMAIIGSGTGQADVSKIARDVKKLVREKGSELSFDDLMGVNGMALAKTTKFIAAFELWKRQFEVSERPIIDSPEKAVEQLTDIRDKKQEHFVALTLDGANRLIAKRTITIGTLTSSLVHPREVFAEAITDRAASIIVAHNHPSGSLKTSKADKEITKRLADVAEMVGIKLIYHVLITNKSYTTATF